MTIEDAVAVAVALSVGVTVSVKVRPERGDELRAAHDAITPGYHLNKRHWVTVTLDGRVPPELIRELIVGSHAQRRDLGL